MVAAAYLQGVTDAPPPQVPDTPARRLRDALEPLATHGWWCRPVHDRLAPQGLDFLGTYVWGRAASLGKPVAAVVVSTFGVFEPGFLTSVYEAARRAVSRDEVLAARTAGVEASLGTILGQQDDADFAAVIEPLADATAGLDGAARPLFSGLRALPWPESPAGRLWRAAELVREHRGDGHLAACAGADLDAATMNVLTELWLGMPLGSYSATRGFGPPAIDAAATSLRERGWMLDGELTLAGRDARLAIEAATDASQASLVRALGAGMDGLIAAADRLSAHVVAAGVFPTDPHKRAAG